VAVTLLLAAVVAGSIVYCVLTVIAARRYLAVRLPPLDTPMPLSVLKPCAGFEAGFESNLRTFFEQDYPSFEILFATRTEADTAVPVIEQLRAEYPRVPSRLIFVGEPPYANAKVWSLDRMKIAAAHDVLVMSDSDIHAEPGLLRIIAAEFQDSRLGIATCPYRAVPARSLWSTLEALGINTQFLGGVLTARMLEGMRFALGPTIAARKSVLDAIGGFDRLKDYLAEDFVMGAFAADAGHGVILSSAVIEHHIGGHGFLDNLTHRIRWSRSTRRSRPAGYVGELFTMPVPPALLLLAWAPSWWPLCAAAIAMRAVSAWACAGWVLRDPLTARLWWMLPVQDVLAFAVWIAGFFGNTILWRGRRYKLNKDGTFEYIG
jgi:ceramide glucosyltransferase